MTEPKIRPKAVLVVEDIDCANCKGTGYEPGHEPTGSGVPYRWCSTCQGQKVRHRAMPIEDFARLFTWGKTIHFSGLDQPIGETNDIRVRAPNEGDPHGK